MFSLIAQTKSPVDVFGKLTPPPGGGFGIDPVGGISTLIIFLIQTFLIIAAIASLIYLLWGAFDWITSNGEKEKLDSARQKMTNAVIGIILVVAALGIFVLINTSVLHIIKRGPNGEWVFGIPTIN